MIISKFVKTKVFSKNYLYLKNLDYDVNPLGAPRWGHEAQIIDMKVEHLKPRSQTKVECKCDRCSKIFVRKFSNIHHDFCNECIRNYLDSERMKGNTLGEANKGKKLISMTGELHPRWNPNKTEFQKYSRRVHWLTRKKKEIWSKWKNADKIELCGKKDGYQLDHKVSIKYGFDNHIVPELIADVRNLEIISWCENRIKHKSNSIDLWELLL